MRIAIIGTGYVGLVTGACFAEMGHTVTCLDIDSEKIALLQRGELPFYEPGLSDVVTRGVKSGRLLFTDSYTEGIKDVAVCFLALPTPSEENGLCDLSHVISAAETLAKEMVEPLIIVNKSTVPVGTAETVRETVQKVLETRGADIPFDIVSNPEFLREGTAVSDCMKPDRVVIGVGSKKAEEIMAELYAPFTLNHDRLMVMDIPSAELSKYAANAMLATRISFMNELAGLCEKLGANIRQLRLAMGSDHRIGYQYLYPGIGFGGSCLPKDIRSLRATANLNGYDTPLLDSVQQINTDQQERFFQKVVSYFENLEGKVIAIWGLSFKPDTDDLREAPALHLSTKLLAAGAHLRLYDPVALEKARPLFERDENVTFCSDEYHAAEEADAIILTTEWKQFRFADFDKLVNLMKGIAFFDGRNQYKAQEMESRGFDYFCIGKAPVRQPMARS
ncbi:MAG: UDP-glucose 6-dehydrogenase TuaD [Chlamydiae bacterium]|nr:UDP-glucose 6-dehydrogenase TuaD [Chlamydiota bacterium]